MPIEVHHILCTLPPTMLVRVSYYIHKSRQHAIIFLSSKTHLPSSFAIPLSCVMSNDQGGGHPPPVGDTTNTSHMSSPSTLSTSPAMQIAPPPMRTIWDCVMINQVTVDEKRGWQCLWCNRRFVPEHATRALNHVLKVSKAGIAKCTARIEDPYLRRYEQLRAQAFSYRN